MRRLLLALATFAVVLVIILFWKHLFWWLEVHTGTVNESGPYYGFFSGFGSDLGEATIVVGILAAYRSHNCHVARCPRLGKPVEGTAYIACPRHHPQHAGDKRAVAVDEIHRAFKERRK